MGDQIQKMLNTQFFDPTQEKSSDPGLLRDFKALVQSDYEKAELIYASVIIAGMLIFAQQGVRIYKHCVFMPDNLCPLNSAVDPFSSF